MQQYFLYTLMAAEIDKKEKSKISKFVEYDALKHSKYQTKNNWFR
jgi:hypothetical protein